MLSDIRITQSAFFSFILLWWLLCLHKIIFSKLTFQLQYPCIQTLVDPLGIPTVFLSAKEQLCPLFTS